MPDPTQLPSLLSLLADDDPRVRRAVLDELASYGDELTGHLQSLEAPPSDERVRQIERLVVLHRGGGRKRSRELERRPLFRPGDLVLHRRYGYRGVVVNFDISCQASREWYQSNRTQPARNQPWFHVLVHGGGAVTYAAQTSLMADESTDPVAHPLVPAYFDRFEDGRYVRNGRPWPDDAA